MALIEKERRVYEKAQWHLEKNISVTHIFTTISAIVSLVIVGSHFDTRLSVLEREVAYKGNVDARQQTDIDLFKHDVREDLRIIADKLDRLAENQNRGKQ